MAYVCLFRQYRPQRFEEVYGQEHVTRTLQNALRLGRIGQAYLFCGPRGVGKTSVARILAKVLNCEGAHDFEPCGECDSCRRINAGSSLGVIEIDAASHRSIDDIRSLREDVQFSPTDARMKIYILDEAHQITGPAFEAFLKTLEEPPPHALFVLATTEPHKIPATILSRCQRFDFRRVGIEEIARRLVEIAGREQISVDPPAVYAVARAADGSLRDALSILDQIIAFSGGTVTARDVELVLGTLDRDTRFAIADHLAADDLPACLDWLAQLLDSGRDAGLLVDQLLEHFRLLLLARLDCCPEELSTLPEDTRERVQAQAAQFQPARLMAVIELLAQCDKALRWHPNPRILLELTLIDAVTGSRPALAAAAPQPPSEARRAARVEEPPPPRRAEAERQPPRRESEPPNLTALPAAPPARAAMPPLAADEPLDLAAVQARAGVFMATVREVAPQLVPHLLNASPTRVDGTRLTYTFRGWEASLHLCAQPERKSIIEGIWERLLGRKVVFHGELATEAEAEPTLPVEVVRDLDAAVDVALDVFPGAELLDG